MKQIPGQMSMLDIITDKKGFSCGEQYRAEGYTNAYDAMPDHPCEVEVIDHEGNRFKSVAKISFGSMVFDTNKYGDRGYGICWWREIKQKTCATCGHFCWVWNPDGDPYRQACFGFVISRSDNPDQEACEAYEEREEDPDGKD